MAPLPVSDAEKQDSLTDEADVLVRGSWLHATLDACQVLLGHLTLRPFAEWARHTGPALQRIPECESRAEALLLRSLLFRVITGAVMALNPRDISRLPLSLFRNRMNDGSVDDPVRMFQEAIAAAASCVGSVDDVERLRRIIESRYGERLSLRTASAIITHGFHYRSLGRAFRQRYGVSFHGHLTAVRLRHAMQLLMQTTMKVEAVAREVGYSSKKELFVHLKRETGLTPGQLRRIAQERSTSESLG